MYNKLKLAIIVLLQSNLVCFAQHNNVWLFSDSLGIDFTSGSPVVFQSQVSAFNYECDANICDHTGSNLFYVSTKSYSSFVHELKNSNDSTVPGGDTININPSSTQGALFIPHPSDTSLYYLFYHYSDNPVSNNFCVALINKDSNNNSGQVIYKDSVLASGYFAEKLTAVKHDNGLNWWILVHKSTSSINPIAGTNCFYIFQLDSTGVQQPLIQCDSFYYYNPVGYMGQMISSPDGNKLACAIYASDTLISYDFNRCTGQLSNLLILKTFNTSGGYPYGCSFSGSGNMLYASNANYLYQFNLQAPNVQASKTLLWHLNDNMHIIGQHQYAPDNKIYIASRHGLLLNPPATVYNTYLSVISNPDSAGLSCNFSANSLYLGGRKSSTGLPNMVNYSLGAIEPPCVVNINEVTNNNNEEFVIYPNPATSTIIINATHSNEKQELIIYSVEGRKILQQHLQNAYEVIDISSLEKGVYCIALRAKDGVVSTQKLVVVDQ